MSQASQSQQVEDENEWFFDIILNFMRSPRWKTPVHSFIDQYCIVFDNEDENKFEYTHIHEEFKKIVEELLGELLAEFDISQEQFLGSFQKAQKNPQHKRIVDQIMAVDNFILFKKMMARRNNELNEKAMQMMLRQEEKKRKLIEKQKMLELQFSQNISGHKEEEEVRDSTRDQVYDDDLRRALTESQQLEQRRKQDVDEEEEMIKRAMEMSMQDEQIRIEKQKSQHEQEEQKLLEKVRQLSLEEHKEKELKERVQQQQEYERLNSQHMEQLRKSEVIQPKAEAKPKAQPQPEPAQPKQEQAQPKVNPMKEQISSEKEAKEMGIEKKEQLKEEVKVASNEKKQAKRMGGGYALPPVSKKKDADFDPSILRDQRDKILKGFNEFDMVEASQEQKSMKDMFREHREKAEEILSQSQPGQESVEERRRRLRAHRDLLVKQTNDKRKEDLDIFNTNTNKAQDQLKSFKDIDKKYQEKAAQQSQSNFDDLDQEDRDLDSKGMDKRLEMYKKMKQQILSDMEKNKQDDQKKKMDEIQKKIEALERAKKQKEDQERVFEEHQKEREELRRQKHKGFLEGIKTFMVEDI